MVITDYAKSRTKGKGMLEAASFYKGLEMCMSQRGYRKPDFLLRSHQWFYTPAILDMHSGSVPPAWICHKHVATLLRTIFIDPHSVMLASTYTP